jgi:hypothetical protein
MSVGGWSVWGWQGWQHWAARRGKVTGGLADSAPLGWSGGGGSIGLGA